MAIWDSDGCTSLMKYVSTFTVMATRQPSEDAIGSMPATRFWSVTTLLRYESGVVAPLTWFPGGPGYVIAAPIGLPLRLNCWSVVSAAFQADWTVPPWLYARAQASAALSTAFWR